MSLDYDPRIAPDPERWLDTDEDLRLMAMEEWAGDVVPGNVEAAHVLASMLAVENQLAADKPPEARATMQRLQSAGLDRYRALIAMAQVVGELAETVMDESRAGDIDTNASLLRGYAEIDPEHIARLAEDALADAPGIEEESFEDFRDRLMSEIPPVDPALKDILDDFAARQEDKETLDFDRLAGFFFGLLACPELVMPSEWTEVIQGDVVFEDEGEAQRVMEARMQLYNWAAECRNDDLPALPPGCAPADDPMVDVDEDTGFSRWCRGAIMAHGWLSDAWQQAVPEGTVEDRILGRTALTLSFFIGRDYAEQAAETMGLGPDQLPSIAETFRFGVLDSLGEYIAIGRQFSQTNRPPSRPAHARPATSTKVGRNESCPCGSGKKFKKCCGGPRSVH
ncbi:UPF0149 family protein [Wenzhouxiangella sp. XN79A]|uniref:UPF0149 family protein n=1 Tax=Wenzhouxiangella sp. XN79A TaxID=2724193 RepID=UPI00144A947C|nr:UPF0149 family protein [Wenzhouxiangella sp. XN79A]NKI35163.1 UPF0149 family protein [Wenzhouxiangella sp. XN79A]